MIMMLCLDMSTDRDFSMLSGRLFDSVGTAATKAILSKCPKRLIGGVNWLYTVDRRVSTGVYGTNSLRIYASASPFRVLFVSKRILKSIFCFTRNHCRLTRGNMVVFAPFCDNTSRVILIDSSVYGIFFFKKFPMVSHQSWFTCSRYLLWGIFFYIYFNYVH